MNASPAWSSAVNLTRDGQDNVTTYADPRNLATTYVRNGFGEVIRQASPDSGTTDTVRDARGLATQITDGRGIVTQLAYDNAGRVLTKAYPAATGENIWLPEAEIAPTFGSRTVVDRPVAVVSGVNATPVTYTVHVDHLNRPIKMTDSTKTTVWDAVWAPWGNVYSITGTATLDARLPGQWFQLESGLHYNWHRHYDPTLGRYTQPDPLGFVDGPSVYGYAGGSPLRYVDRDGRFRPTPTPLPPELTLPKPPVPGPYSPWPIPDPLPESKYLPPENLNPPSPGGDNAYYHKVCDQPPPSNLTKKCDLLLWKLDRQRLCLKLRKKWRQDYGPAQHDNQLPYVEESILNLENEIRKNCQPGDLFACRAN